MVPLGELEEPSSRAVVVVRRQREEHARWVLEQQHCEDTVRQLGGADAVRALRRHSSLDRDDRERRLLALIKDIGHFLMVQDQGELWRLLYTVP